MNTIEITEPVSDEANSWTLGWVFFKTGGQETNPDRHPGPDLAEWVKGFAAAMADYDLNHEYSSLQDALQQLGVEEELVMACLDAAERIIAEPEFNRWPNVPVMTLPDRRLITEPDSFGYQVRFMRRLVRYSKYFSFNQYGGRGKALSAAIRWRDKTLREIKTSGKRSVNTPRNTTTTGITGVSRRVKSDHGKPKRYLSYSVFWVNNGKSSARSFQVGNLDTISADDELHAFRTARLFRYLYERSIDEGVAFDPSIFRGWKKKRLYDDIEVAS